MMPLRSRLAALFLALAAASFARPAAAQTLIVDSADSNTPYTPTADATYTIVHVGETGTGEIDQSAHTLTVGVNGNSDDQLFIGYGSTAQGTYNLSGTATLNAPNIVDVGTFGTGTFNQTGGAANFTSGYINSLDVGVYNGSVGTYTQSAGTVLTSNVLISDYAGSTGTYNLDGGTLSVGSVFGGFNGGTASTFNLNGGTLQVTATGTNLLGSLTRANVREGGAVIDANGFNTFIPETLSHSNIKGDADADGGLTVSTSAPNGSVTVFSSNTYTGRTLVNSGALFVDNNTAKASNSGTGSGNVFVNTGAWLGGLGTIGGNVTVGSGAPMTTPAAPAFRPQFINNRGTLTPGDNITTVGTLAIHGNLTLTPGLSMTELDLGDPASVGSDLVKVGGNLSIGGDLQLTLAAGFTPTYLQTFTLIDVTGTGTTTGTFENTTDGGALYTDANGDTFLIDYHAAVESDGQLNDVTATFLSVPEPSTWTLLGLGGVILFVASRRRRFRRA